MNVLFVCTGNICRSPMAERLAVAFSAQADVHTVSFASAGTGAVIGHPIHARAARVLEGLGGDPTDFAARQLTAKMAAASDLVLTMTRAHRESVLEYAPRNLSRTFTLAEAASLAGRPDVRSLADLAALRPELDPAMVADIADPIGRSIEVFAETGSAIAQLLPPVLECCWRTADASAH